MISLVLERWRPPAHRLTKVLVLSAGIVLAVLSLAVSIWSVSQGDAPVVCREARR